MKRIALLMILMLAGCATAQVSEQATTITHDCDGNTTSFSFPFRISASSDVKVILVDVSDTTAPTETLLSETTHYTVAVTNNLYPADGGTVTTVSTYSSSYDLVITTDIDLNQSTSLRYGNWRPVTVQRMADLSRLIDNEFDRRLGLCIKIPESDSGDTTELDPGGTAGYLYRDADGDISTVTGITSGTVSVSSFWETGLAKTTLAASKTYLGVDWLINAADYGADGSDASDDTSAIQAAIDAAEALGYGASVYLPEGTYYTSSSLTMEYEHLSLIGSGAIIDYNTAGYALTLAESYMEVKGILFIIGKTATGGISIDGDAVQAQCNYIHHCRIKSDNEATDKSTSGRCGLNIQCDDGGTYAAYFNTIAYCRISGFYDGVQVDNQSNANYFLGNTIEYYYRYGIALNNSDESIVNGGFFQQAAGRDAGDLTYAIFIDTGGTYHLIFTAIEPGNFSSPAYVGNSSNVFFVNDNCPYGYGGSTTPVWISPQGYFQLTQGPLIIGNSATTSPLRLTERSTAPSSTTAGNIYLDDGTNTAWSGPGFRRGTGSAYEDIGPGMLNANASWDAAAIADGDEEAKEVTVTGAALGDFAVASLSIDVNDLQLSADVTATNTVTCVLSNSTNGSVNLDAATVYVRVFQK